MVSFQGAVKIMAKDLVRTRNYITRFIEMKTHLNAVSLKMQVFSSLLHQYMCVFRIIYNVYYGYRRSNRMMQWQLR